MQCDVFLCLWASNELFLIKVAISYLVSDIGLPGCYACESFSKARGCITFLALPLLSLQTREITKVLGSPDVSFRSIAKTKSTILVLILLKINCKASRNVQTGDFHRLGISPVQNCRKKKIGNNVACFTGEMRDRRQICWPVESLQNRNRKPLWTSQAILRGISRPEIMLISSPFTKRHHKEGQTSVLHVCTTSFLLRHTDGLSSTS